MDTSAARVADVSSMPTPERALDADIHILEDLVSPFREVNQRLSNALSRIDNEPQPIGGGKPDAQSVSASYHPRLRAVIGDLRGISEEAWGLLDRLEKLV